MWKEQIRTTGGTWHVWNKFSNKFINFYFLEMVVKKVGPMAQRKVGKEVLQKNSTKPKISTEQNIGKRTRNLRLLIQITKRTVTIISSVRFKLQHRQFLSWLLTMHSLKIWISLWGQQKLLASVGFLTQQVFIVNLIDTK